MIDIKLLRSRSAKFKAAILRRYAGVDLDALLELDGSLLTARARLEKKRRERNEVSAEIGRLLREKKDVSAIKANMEWLPKHINTLEATVKEVEAKFREAVLMVPNMPHESVPDGESENDNREIRTWGEPCKLDFTPKSHVELGEKLGILDLKRAAKISGARFAIYRGNGARLERALISFMLNTHTANGYEEILPPFMVNRKAMTGTGQLPKFEDDLFKIEDSDYYLIPTGEVPLTNIYADEILDAEQLPLKMCAYTPCWRREAGSYGKDTAGIIRQHQFNKVELVKLTMPENSMAELESLTADAEAILQKLELPYRVVELCAGDLGFASAKTYDIEVWLPSQNRYREISSCSNFSDFQARRAGIRFKRDKKASPELVHTINGSGLAVGRTVVAILENFQQKDGSVTIPQALKHYMNDLPTL